MRRPDLQRLLPAVFQQAAVPGTLLGGLLDSMEELHRPCEQVLAQLDAMFDPRRAPDAFVPFLAKWVHFDHLYDSGDRRSGSGAQRASVASIGHLRELVASAAFLAKWRGTAQGLIRFLHTATGLGGFAVEEAVDAGGRPRPFHIRVLAPDAARSQHDLVHKIVRMAKPAHVTYDLVFAAAAT